MSTDEVFGDSSLRCQGNPLFEPTNPYSATKASAEMLVKSYRSSFKLPIVVVRSNNVRLDEREARYVLWHSCKN